MDPISLEDLALLELLLRIDQRADPVEGDTDIVSRLVDSGLVEQLDGEAVLTVAGIELCKSLQHRAAADEQAKRILRQRGSSGGVSNGGDGHGAEVRGRRRSKPSAEPVPGS
ncbi:hypothetical protein [Luteimonas sp. R10]|uniref:hypothetical protein n=1 Tax=Luteimonas sp. R10 TaxID=3108176 RepID=UPI0030928689|nr:hypothetical protein U3649_15585 [Luteimonas sp. R10]